MELPHDGEHMEHLPRGARLLPPVRLSTAKSADAENARATQHSAKQFEQSARSSVVDTVHNPSRSAPRSTIGHDSVTNGEAGPLGTRAEALRRETFCISG